MTAISLLIAAVVNSTLTAGDTYAFTNAIGTLPQTVPFMDSVAAEDTPGSTNWYVRIDNIRVPHHWHVTSNNVPVALSEEPVAKRYADPSKGGEWQIGIDLPNGTTTPYFPNMFDLGWHDEHATYYAVATNMTDFSTVGNYGHPLYWMKAHKEDASYFYSQIASMNAYFERLYYGTFPGYNTRTPPEDFRFDKSVNFGGITNRQSTAYDHRLLEHSDVTNFLEHVNGMRQALYATAVYGDPIDGKGHPAFANDEENLLDLSYTGTEQYSGLRPNDAHLWWASTREPPARRQDIGQGTWIYPRQGEMDELMPYFGWTKEAIAYQDPTTGEWFESKLWQIYSMCLGWFFGNSPHPISKLFEAVGVVQSAGSPGFIRKYELDGNGAVTFLTNAYPFASCPYPDGLRSFADYAQKCLFGPWCLSRKLTPGQMVGANHILGVMDRTIYIPAMLSWCYPVFFKASAKATYSSSGSFHAEAHWDDTEEKFILTGADDYVFNGTRSDYDENIDYDWDYDDPVDYLPVRVSAVSDSEPQGQHGLPPEASDDITLDNELFGRFVEEWSDAMSYAMIFDITVIGDGIKIWLDVFDDSGDYMGWDTIVVPTDGWHDLSFDMTPSVDFSRSYEYTLPEYPYAGLESYPNFEMYLPCHSHVDRVSKHEVAFLDRRDLDYARNADSTPVTVTEYKCDGTQTTDEDIINTSDDHQRDLIDEQIDHAKELIGDFEDVGSFAKLPDKATFKIKGKHAFLLRDQPTIEAKSELTSYNYPYNHYKVTYRIPRQFYYVTTNTTVKTRKDEVTVRAVATEWRYKTEEGWTFNTAETNVISSETRPVSSNDVTKAGERFLDPSDFTWNEYETEFDEYDKDEILWWVDVYYYTNVLTFTYTTNTTVYVHPDFVVTNIMTDMTADPPTVITNIETRSFSYDKTESSEDLDETWDGPSEEYWGMTYGDALKYATSVITNELTIECAVLTMIKRDYSWTSVYTNPFTGEEELLGSGHLPMNVGAWSLSLMSDEKNAWEIKGIPNAFSGYYKNDSKFKAIEAVNWKWKSMNRSDISD